MWGGSPPILRIRRYGYMKTILVHGHVNEELQAVLVEQGCRHTKECYLDGGYMITLATDSPEFSEDLLLQVIYDSEDIIPDIRHSKDEPIFTGIQDTPIMMVTEDGEEIEFLGGYHGYEEDGVSQYQD